MTAPDTARDTALAWARARAGGPLRTRPDAPVPDGMIRLAEPDGTAAWLVPRVPDTADTRVLAELGLPGPLLEMPNDTARLLAAALRCCWEDPHEPPWPGRRAAEAEVLAVFGDLTGPRDEAAHRRSAVAGLRRLDQAGWLLWDEKAGAVRLGPRVALWSGSDLAVLRQLWRSINHPEHSAASETATQDVTGGAGQPPAPEPAPEPGPGPGAGQ